MSDSDRILLVDDDPNLLAGLQRTLRKQFKLTLASGPGAGLEAVERDGPFSVVVSDMQMPGMNGVQFLSRVESIHPETVRVMLTGNADQKTAMDAVNDGHIFRFLTKPCEPEALSKTLAAALAQHRLVTAERELLEKTLNGSIRVLLEILSMADMDAFGRTQAVRPLVSALAIAARAPNAWEIEIASMLAPLGYITVPPEVTARSRRQLSLTGPEKDMIGRVPEVSSRLLANIPRLQGASRIVLYQNKRFDGGGFPVDAVKGEEIPAGARILRIAIDLGELRAAGRDPAEAIDQMERRTGWYDPALLRLARETFAAPAQHLVYSAMEQVRLGVAELAADMVLAADVITADERLLLRAGHRLTETIIDRLRNFSKVSGIKEPLLVERPVKPAPTAT